MQEEYSYDIYWEKQGADYLCAVHCINSLLQGPFFDEIKLSEIALELDRKEKNLMQAHGMTHNYQNYLKEKSGNVAMDGDFSLQVLLEALKTLRLEMVAIGAIKDKSQLNLEEGFICNSSYHWFSIRKIRGIWYNLNSLKKNPKVISDFYLSAFLASVEENGYQIFAVQGPYPLSDKKNFAHYKPNQMWYPAKKIHEEDAQKKRKDQAEKGKQKNKGFKPFKGISKKIKNKFKFSSSSSECEQVEKRKIQQPIVKKKEESFIPPYDKFKISPQDKDLIAILKMQLQEEFIIEPSQGYMVNIKLGNGNDQQFVRMFRKDQTIQSIYDCVWKDRDPRSKFYLVEYNTQQKLFDLQIGISVLQAMKDGYIKVSVVNC